MSAREYTGGAAFNSQEFLELLAGDRCPCGHPVRDHAEPAGDLSGMDFEEVCGPCGICECKGYLQ